MEEIQQRENRINSLTGNDWPFYYSAVWHYFEYILRILNDNSKTGIGGDSNQSFSPLEMTIHSRSLTII
jgi:hypothetical protein